MGPFHLEWRELCLAIILGLLTFFTFLPTLRCQFVNLDDGQFVSGNAHVVSGLTFDNVRWAFSGFELGFYSPLTWLSLQLDAQFYGLQPWGYHLTNTLLHSANAALLFGFLRLATGSIWRSAAAAAVFALHPLRVESVAWVAERKDVLSAFFGFLALIAYVRYVRRPGISKYGLVLTAFGLSLLSKATLVSFPFLLLLLDVWPLGRLSPPQRRRLGWLAVEKVPFVVAATLMAAITVWAQNRCGYISDRISFGERVANALLSYLRYLQKMVRFDSLAVWYSFRPVGALAGIGAAAVVLLVVLLVLWQARRRPWLAVGWFWFLGTLVPVIGLIKAGSIAMADRYSYFPCIGLLIMAFWSLPELRTVSWKLSCAGAVAAVLLVLCLATQRQIAYWRTSKTLWVHDLRVADSGFGRHCLAGLYVNDGVEKFHRGDVDGAIVEYRRALRLSPDLIEAHCNLGADLAMKGRWGEAIDAYKNALLIDPNFAEARLGLAVVLQKSSEAGEVLPVQKAPGVAAR